MPSGDILYVVIHDFLSKVELEGQLPSEVVDELKRLSEEGGLADEEAIKAALKKEPLADDEAERS